MEDSQIRGVFDPNLLQQRQVVNYCSAANLVSYLYMSYLYMSYLYMSYLYMSYLYMSYLYMSYLYMSYLYMSYLYMSYLYMSYLYMSCCCLTPSRMDRSRSHQRASGDSDDCSLRCHQYTHSHLRHQTLSVKQKYHVETTKLGMKKPSKRLRI